MRSVRVLVAFISVAFASTPACSGEGCDPQPRSATRVPDGEYVEPMGVFRERRVNGSDLVRSFPHGVFELEVGGAGGEGGAMGSSDRGPGLIPSGRVAIDRAAMRLVRSYSDIEGRAVVEAYRLVEYDEESTSCSRRYDYPETTGLELEQVLLDDVPQPDHTAYEGWTVSLSGELHQDDGGSATEVSYSVVTFTATQSSDDRYDSVSWQESYVP